MIRCALRRTLKFNLVLVAIVLTAGGVARAQTASEKAWTILDAGVVKDNTTDRAMAVQVLGMLHDPKARMLAENALNDEKPEVRSAGATALGKMNAKSADQKLKNLILNDKDAGVVLAAASALHQLGDPAAYQVYYAVLTGQRKSGAGLLEDQKKMLSDTKKMAQFGFETGIGFIPFGGLGLGVFKAVTKDDASPIRAAAAQELAKDPDPKTAQALVYATTDKSWIVRVAALDAIAKRGDPKLSSDIEVCMGDDKPAVQYTAAATILRLAEISAAPAVHPKSALKKPTATKK